MQDVLNQLSKYFSANKNPLIVLSTIIIAYLSVSGIISSVMWLTISTNAAILTMSTLTSFLFASGGILFANKIDARINSGERDEKIQGWLSAIFFIVQLVVAVLAILEKVPVATTILPGVIYFISMFMYEFSQLINKTFNNSKDEG